MKSQEIMLILGQLEVLIALLRHCLEWVLRSE